MNRSQLIRAASKRHQIPQTLIESCLQAVTETIAATLASGESITIKNFGQFEPRERRPATKRNPRNGEEIKVGRRTAILFHAAPALKETVNAEGQAT